jgi:hypothetical protein
MAQPKFTIDESSRKRIVVARIEASRVYSCSPDDCVARLVSVSKPVMIGSESTLGRALDEELDVEATRKLVEMASVSRTYLDIGFMSRGELEGQETIRIHEIEFCMPSTMYEALRGYVLAWRQEGWELELKVPGSN